MATQDGQASNASATKPDIALGEFPFPLTDGPTESRYLTWLRNHSNYMAVRGFLDYLRSVGVLLRGIIINFLIFLPYLLIIAIVLAYAHHWMLANPFFLTLWAIVLGVVWILLFPIAMPLYKIVRYRKSLQTGSESSVKQRDLYERTFKKDEMMEIYLNIIEFGPDIYGVKNAAWHYFGRRPAELNLAECLFLSSLLPKPREYHKLYEKGELPQSWLFNIRQLMEIAHKNARISDKELEEGKQETIVFHKEDAPPPVPRAAVTGSHFTGDDAWEAN